MSTISSALHWAALSVPTLVVPVFVSVRRGRRDEQSIIAERRLDALETSAMPEEHPSQTHETGKAEIGHEEEPGVERDLVEDAPCESQSTTEERSEPAPVRLHQIERSDAVRSYRRRKIIQKAKARIVTQPLPVY